MKEGAAEDIVAAASEGDPMRMRDALVLVSIAVLAACGRQPGAQVKMMGFTPHTGLQKDQREIRCYCPLCGAQLEAGADRCPQKSCTAWVEWQPTYPCGYCGGTGNCAACVLMEKEEGKCLNCKGRGFLAYQGRTLECPDCRGTKVCSACKGSQKCDFCGGEKVLAFDVVKAKARRPGEERGEEGRGEVAPPSKVPAATPEKQGAEAKPTEEKE